MTKFKLDLHNPYSKFELNVGNLSRDNEWKPMIMTERQNDGKGVTLYASSHFMANFNEILLNCLIFLKVL
jgi:hypothetical protein